jgi:hypothetical protein
VVYDKTDADTGMTTAARVRVSLNPRQIVHIDSTDNKSINLQCGDRAEMLAPRSPAPTVSRAAPSTVVVPPSSVLSFMALMTVSRSGYWHKASVLLAELDVSS